MLNWMTFRFTLATIACVLCLSAHATMDSPTEQASASAGNDNASQLQGDPQATQGSTPTTGAINSEQNAKKGAERKGEDSQLQEVIVTGTFLPVSKQQATTAISTIDAIEIGRLVSITPLDVLSNVPGVFVDTSQGMNFIGTATTPYQIQSRGLGFTMLEEDGLPVQVSGNFLGGSAAALLRVDSTLDQVQVVRGGSAAITGANAPGGIFNYLSKTGGDTLSGTIAASYGLEGNLALPYERGEFNVGGPLAPNGWSFNVGGYYQHDYGFIDTGYPMDFGGQLKGNITKKFDSGVLQIYAKYLNDHNGNTNNTGRPAVDWSSPTLVPGWSNTSSIVLPGGSFQYQSGPHSYSTFDPEDLMHTVSEYIGVKFSTEIGSGWSLSNNVRVGRNTQNIKQEYFGAPSTLTDFYLYSLLGTYGQAGTYTFRDPATGTSAQVRSLTGTDFTVLSNNLPGTPGVPDTVMLHGAWVLNIDDNQLQDLFSVTKKFDQMSFTVGGYLGRLRQELLLGGDAGSGVSPYTPTTNMLDINLRTPSGATLQLTNPAGYGYPTAAAQGATNSTWDQLAGFFGHTWNFASQWSLDWGVRYESVRVNANNDSGNDYSVTNSSGTNVWANSYYVIAPPFHVDRSIDTFAYSGAVNHEFDDSNSVYLRYSLGKKSPDLSFYGGINAATPEGATQPIAERVTQWELGYKRYTSRISLDVTPYYSLLSSISSNPLYTVTSTGQAGPVYTAFTPANKTSNYGLEIDARFHFDYGFALRTAFTWQRSKEISSYFWTQPNGPGPASNPLENALLVDSSAGARAENIPDVLAMVAPSYSNGRFFAQVQWQYVGNREANNFDAWLLPAYQQTNVTIQWNFSDRLIASLSENNVFNSGGIMEWSPPGDILTGTFSTGAYTRAQVLANPNGVFSIVQIPARAAFLKVAYTF